jgi:regulator of protease activity HflC (stomatin/prohibitin superfamily)
MRSLVALALFTLLTLTSACSKVTPGYVGVWTSWSETQDGVWTEGWYGMSPMSSMITYDTRLQRMTITAVASSKDMQVVTSEVVLSYRLDGDHVRDIYQTIGTMEALNDVVIQPALNESVKAATAQYTAEELVTKRAEVKDAIQTALEPVLNRSWIELGEVSLTDFRYDEDFQHAIEAKQIAEQAAAEALNDLARIKTEALQAAATAGGEAAALLAVATAEAAAQTLLADTVTDRTLRLRAIDKWDGELSGVAAGDGGLELLLGTE